NSRFQLAALKMIVKWPTDDFKAAQASVVILSEHRDWRIRREVVRASYFLPYDEREEIVHRALEDKHPAVRMATVKDMAERYSDPQQWLASQLLENQSGSPRARQAMLDYLIEQGAAADVLQSISVVLAENAVQMHDADTLLEKEEKQFMPAMLLMRLVIGERRQELVDLSLLALQASPHDSEIAGLRAALKSRDSHLVSNACVQLSMLSNKRLTSLLRYIFDATGDSHPVMNEGSFLSITDVLAWIASGTDPWLNKCADYLNSSMRSSHHV
ncbi:MAG: hypothetical protein U9N50_11580, partial [Pseudomonadota bacterium]|nr:hypothetical protein [Pseudomonadota bacterium]